LRALHQFVPTLQRSAVGDHVLEVQRVLRDLGVRSDIYAEVIRPDCAGRGMQFSDYARAARPEDVLLYHVAQGATMADVLMQRPETLLIDHHNITLAKFFISWEPATVPGLLLGRRQLASLASRTTLGLADSSYNRSELDDLGFANTAVVPILLDTADFDRHIDDQALDRLTTETTNWLFVGRVAPNKMQHDLIKAFVLYRQVYDPTARLRIVGEPASDGYFDALVQFIDRLGMSDVIELTGSVSDGELTAHYRAADVYVCVSEHEGFCVPLLEAMHNEVPVVAYASTAVPETLGDGGLLLPNKQHATVAAAVWRVVSDDDLRRTMVARGKAHLADYALPVSRQKLVDALTPVLA
jgi:L-malate glycosyltransferase